MQRRRDKALRRLTRPVLALAGLLGLACTNPPKSQFPTAADAIARMRAGYECSRGLSGEAKIDYIGDDGRLRGRTLFVVSRPEKVRLDVFSPFGVTLSTLTSNGKAFNLLDTANKVYFSGPANECNVERFVHVPVPPHVLTQLMAGEAPILVHQPKQARIAWEGDEYVIRISSVRDASQEICLVPHPADWNKPWQEQRVRVNRVRVVQKDVELYDVEFKGHAQAKTAPPRTDPEGLMPDMPPSGPACFAEVPRRIRFNVETSGQDVIFDYQEVQHNPVLIQSLFSVPVPRGVDFRPAPCR